jgi:hypothetical protein
MESSAAGPLTRGLALLVLALMTAAAVYGAVLALRYFGQIGV